MEREGFPALFLSALENKEIQILNVHGERGVGKTFLGEQIRKDARFQARADWGLFDLREYTGITYSVMVDALYELCDILMELNLVQLLHFTVADDIDSRRSGRVSYTERGVSRRMDRSLAIHEFVSSFVDVPYLGAGLRTVKLLSKAARRFMPRPEREKILYQRYSQMTEEALKQALPAALAEDLTLSAMCGSRRPVIFLENYDCAGDPGSGAEWLDTLMSGSRDILWVVFSRQPLPKSPRLLDAPVPPLDGPESHRFLEERGVADGEARDHLVKICGGSPLHLALLGEEIQRRSLRGESIPWTELERSGGRQILRDLLNGLGRGRRELLYQLAAADAFDEEMFRLLFPGRIFGLYQPWLDSCVFRKTEEGEYAVQNSLKDEILSPDTDLDRTILSYCHRNLFDYYSGVLASIQNGGRAAPGQDAQALLRRLCFHGNQLKDQTLYPDALLRLRDVWLRNGALKSYFHELERMADRDGLPPTLALALMREVSALAVYLSNPTAARKYIADGAALAQAEEDWESLLQFRCMDMNLQNIFPPAQDAAASAAEEYRAALEQYRDQISYRRYASGLAMACLLLSKKAVVNRDYDGAEALLAQIFELCGDTGRTAVLSLGGARAKALEQLGEIRNDQGRGEEGVELYRQALASYALAEAALPQWDGEFLLNYGLAHKRLAEGYFKLRDLESADRHLRVALSKYAQVRACMPDMIDVYCKIGFACLDGAQRRMAEERFDEDTLRYLNQGRSATEEGCERHQDNNLYTGGETFHRQLGNLRCKGYRLLALYHSRLGDGDAAERAFLMSLSCAREVVAHIPDHPYSHLERAQTCDHYAMFLAVQGRMEESKQYAAESADETRAANGCKAR